MSKYHNTLGRIEAVWNKLGGEDGVDFFLEGVSEVTFKDSIIDTRERPFVPPEYTLFQHDTSLGIYQYHPLKSLVLWQTEEQEAGAWVEYKEMHRQLEGHSYFNARVLDYLLSHPRYIPRKCKMRIREVLPVIYFPGTIYELPSGRRCMRGLFWSGRKWEWTARNNDDSLGPDHFIAVRRTGQLF